jgi:glucose-6-phosphate isomerase
MERYQDPRWVESQVLSLDHNYAMSDFVGGYGLTDADLDGLAPRLADLDREIAAGRADGRLGFMALPRDSMEILDAIKRISKPVTEWCWHVVVLGIGGSALGARALHQALSHPQYNIFPMARRHHRPALWVADNVDPDYFYGLLDGLDLRRTAFNVISKSGSTAETMAQFLFACQLLKTRVGEEKARERLIVTTDPDKGALRELVRRERFPSLSIPPNVGGRFSVLSAVGLLPASLVGIDVKELLAGARYMDQRLRNSEPEHNLAYRLAAIFYLFAAAKGRPMLVLMPYATTLSGLAEWFCQLWAESLGKELALDGRVVHAGSTPVKAVGATDQHSQLQLYMEGPHDKLIVFLEVEKFKHQVEIPRLFDHQEELAYLGGHSLNELLDLERQATAFNLMKAGRPSVTLKLPKINPFTVGQLIYLLEVATIAAAALFGVNPLDQPGVEGGKQTTYGLLGRPGFEARKQEFADAPPNKEKYVVS